MVITEQIGPVPGFRDFNQTTIVAILVLCPQYPFLNFLPVIFKEFFIASTFVVVIDPDYIP